VNFQGKKTNQKGAALLIVIMIAAIMSIIMTLMLHQSRLDMKLAALVKQRTNSELALQTAQSTFVYKAMTSPLHLVGPTFTEIDLEYEPIVSDFKNTVSKDGPISISVQDMAGMVSLLPYDEKNLFRLLIQNGYTDDMLFSFKDRLEDWQDGDSLTRLQGKEIGDYENYPFFPSNMLLQTVNELAYLIEPTVFNDIKKWLVLYGQGDINRQFTPEALYSAAGITITNSKEYADPNDGEFVYPSGRYLVTLSFNEHDISLSKEFLLIRGQDTFQPFFIVNEKIF
jgi:general secretion pathway protein K